jgi:hypothetical protein
LSPDHGADSQVRNLVANGLTRTALDVVANPAGDATDLIQHLRRSSKQCPIADDLLHGAFEWFRLDRLNRPRLLDLSQSVRFDSRFKRAFVRTESPVRFLPSRRDVREVAED